MVGIPVRLTYDSTADAAYVYFVDTIGAGEVARTVASMLELDRSFIAFDLDVDGKVLGMEILGASRVLAQETLQAAEQLD